MQAYSRLGTALFYSRKYDDAAEAFAQGLARAPSNESLQEGARRAAAEGGCAARVAARREHERQQRYGGWLACQFTREDCFAADVLAGMTQRHVRTMLHQGGAQSRDGEGRQVGRAVRKP
eukprot:scaffold1058_cov362-Prasinococcus_capsulatus_cf.AAC.8